MRTASAIHLNIYTVTCCSWLVERMSDLPLVSLSGGASNGTSNDHSQFESSDCCICDKVDLARLPS